MNFCKRASRMYVHGSSGFVVEFFLLCPIEARSEGRQLDLGSPKARCVLALLLLNLGSVMPADVLIDRIWDGRAPSKARGSLSAYVTRLRTVLRQTHEENVRFVGQAGGYLLEADRTRVDLYQFRDLRRRAAGLAGAGDTEGAAVLLREADLLWRGQPLGGLPGEAIGRLRHSLEEERRASVLERVRCDLELGRHAELLSELEQLCITYPMDESFAAGQMTALYRCGRQGDALSVYREIRDRLATEQGAEPGPALSQLHEQILCHVPALAGPGDQRPAASIPAIDTLPPETRDFTGRRAEMDTLIAARNGGVVQIIIGMPGIGKTTLAVRAARALRGRYPGGQVFVNFGTHDPRNPPLDSPAALHSLLRTLGISPNRIPHGQAERAALWQAELARRKIIVILDDAAEAEQVRPLLPAAGESRILITSRNALDGLRDSHVIRLGLLAPEETLELFTRIAGPAATNSTEQLAQVIQLCGGLPLAIQLTARWLRDGWLSAGGDMIKVALGNREHEIRADSPVLEVMSAFELSYRAMPHASRRFFRRLGLHPSTDITDYAAAALAGTPLADARGGLAALVERHLVEDRGSSYRFHDLIRQFAASCARREEQESDRRRAFDRILSYYLHTAGRADWLLYRHPDTNPAPTINPAVAVPELETREHAAAWMELEWRGVLHAAARAAGHERKKQSARLVAGLAGFMEAAGHWKEAESAHARALQACRDLDDQPGIAQASLDLSRIAGRLGHHHDGLRHGQRAAAIWRSLSDNGGLSAALDQIGTLHRLLARFRESLAYHQEASDLYHASGDLSGVASTLNHAAITCYHLGRYPAALEHLTAALDLYRRTGDKRGEAKTLNNIGNMQRYQGYHRDALVSYQSALEIFQVIGGEHNQAILHENIGCIEHYRGNYQKALAAYQRALAISRKIGNLPDEAGTLNEMGVTLTAIEEHDDALTHHQRAALIAEQLGNSYEQVIALRGIGDSLRGKGLHDQAAQYYQQALLLSREISEPFQEGKVLDAMAETALQTEGPTAARIYWHQALDAYQQLGVPEAETVRLRLDSISAGKGPEISQPLSSSANDDSPGNARL
jgi:DNA-binding SARP family transcriptional activator/tetratricopeptide (TPR) repeat protein